MHRFLHDIQDYLPEGLICGHGLVKCISCMQLSTIYLIILLKSSDLALLYHVPSSGFSGFRLGCVALSLI